MESLALLSCSIIRRDNFCKPKRTVCGSYEDPETKTFKLNVERNNGRAAMMGITGMMIHNALGVDALFPIVGSK